MSNINNSEVYNTVWLFEHETQLKSDLGASVYFVPAIENRSKIRTIDFHNQHAESNW